ncbi:MAG: type II toxin-antitoxin system VapC family toxin [Geminicoccaceae bacterium]
MIAVDTNAVVRFLVRDDNPAQSLRAAEAFHADRVFIARTVILETAWVLAFTFGFSRAEVVAALRLLGGLPNVEIEDASGVARALDWALAGLDLADALHLVATPAGAAFVTFDRALASRAAALGAAPDVQAP